MKKSILNIQGVKELNNLEKKALKAGVVKGWDKCCWKEDSEDIPFGCEAWVIC